MVIVNILMEMKPLNKHEVEKTLKKYFRVLLVTDVEDKKLTECGLSSKMPDDWDKNDIWARYKKVGIEPECGYKNFPKNFTGRIIY